MSITDGCPSDPLPHLEPDDRVAGIDWAKDDHAVAVVDAAGRTVERFTVAHTRAGLRELLRRLGRLQVGEVAIGSTRSCWPTRCAPTGPGCGR